MVNTLTNHPKTYNNETFRDAVLFYEKDDKTGHNLASPKEILVYDSAEVIKGENYIDTERQVSSNRILSPDFDT